MRILQTLADIACLEEYDFYPAGFMACLRELFHSLRAGLTDDDDKKTLEEFTLHRYGPLVILEAGDNLADLSFLGLHRAENGLMGAPIESAERNEIDGFFWYELLVVFNNDYAINFFIPDIARLNPQIKTWLETITNEKVPVKP